MPDGLYDGVLGVDADDTATCTALVMELQGVAGTTVASRAEVKTSRDKPAEIACAMTPLVSRATGTGVVAGVVETMRCVLAPQTSREIAIRVTFDPAVFSPGADNFGMPRLSGAGTAR